MKLKPTKDQKYKLINWLQTARKAYNTVLEIRQMTWRNSTRDLTDSEIDDMLDSWIADNGWQAIPRKILLEACISAEAAYVAKKSVGKSARKITPQRLFCSLTEDLIISKEVDKVNIWGIGPIRCTMSNSERKKDYSKFTLTHRNRKEFTLTVKKEDLV